MADVAGMVTGLASAAMDQRRRQLGKALGATTLGLAAGATLWPPWSRPPVAAASTTSPPSLARAVAAVEALYGNAAAEAIDATARNTRTALVIGQSNASGSPTDAPHAPWQLTDAARLWGCWAMAYDGVTWAYNPRRPVFARWNGASFAERMLLDLRAANYRPRVVPAAISGASIRLWQDGAGAPTWRPSWAAPTMASLDGAALSWTLVRAVAAGRVDWVIFQQGEADLNTMDTAQWVDRSAALLKQVRDAVGAKPVYIGEPPRNPVLAGLVDRVHALAAVVPNSRVVMSDGADWSGWHFSRAGADTMGTRYAAAMIA